MPIKIKDVHPPRGFSRWFYRLPIKLYEIGLGGLFGHRFILLTHIGRRSGLPRKVVLEVVRYDEVTGSITVAAGFGPLSDWYRNIQTEPRVVVRSGRVDREMKVEFLTKVQAGAEMLDFAKKHPIAARQLPGVMGYKLNGTDADFRAFGETLRMVRFIHDEA